MSHAPDSSPLCKLLCSLRNLFEDLPRDTIDLRSKIADILSGFSLEQLDEKYIHFDPHRYCRILIAVNKYFSLIVNCWKGGQKTPLHNHGPNNNCSWVYVLKGKFFVSFESAQDEDVKKVKRASAGECIQICNSIGDHVAGNDSEDESCISLHLYWPPYIECCFIESHGAMCTCSEEKLQKFLPVVHCNDRQHYYKENEELEMMALLKSRPLFTNFRKLVEVLRREIVIEPSGNHAPENIKHIIDILSCLNFNQKEWEQYAKFAVGRYTRNLIAYDEKFTILLLCWEKGQMSPIHDHAGSNCWVKVLDGVVEESLYELDEDGKTPNLLSRKPYKPGGVAYINDSYGVHKMGNPNLDHVAISLHVYSPAYHECHIFSEDDPSLKKKVSISTAYGARYPFMEKNITKMCDQESVTTQTMESFIAKLDCLFTSVDICSEKIDGVVSDLVYSAPHWENYIHFSPDQYTRNLLGFTNNYSAVLACWCPNQQTPIHEHGKSEERRVWIKVLAGTLQIQLFEESFNQMVPSTKPPIVLKEGEYTMIQDDTLGLHRTFNASASENCISLHIYSPPYVECSFLEQTGNKKSIPVAYCAKDIANHRAKFQEEDLLLQCKFRSMVFSDFASFSNMINKFFDDSNSLGDINDLKKMLSNIHFHPKEWKTRAVKCKSSPQYTRTLVAYGYSYSIYLLRWGPGQSNEVHNHNQSSSIFKVLEGKLEETIYKKVEGQESLQKIASKSLTQGDVSITNKGDLHTVCNSSKTADTVSLHLFSPPFEECTGYDIKTSSISSYVCSHHFTKCSISKK